jgi:hypothetical protein
MGVWGAKLGQNWGVLAKSLKTQRAKFGDELGVVLRAYLRYEIELNRRFFV